MILIPFLVALTAATIVEFVYRRNRKILPVSSSTWRSKIPMGDWSIVTWIVVSVVAVVTLVAAIYVNVDYAMKTNDLERVEQELAELEDYRESVQSNIAETIDKYPELEIDVVGDIDPEILLQYPQLRSVEALSTQFASLDSAERSILRNRQERLEILKTLRDLRTVPVFYGLLWVSR